jgi:murein DD-endopeptidase MepM/ murein hydrolase activator NlpD
MAIFGPKKQSPTDTPENSSFPRSPSIPKSEMKFKRSEPFQKSEGFPQSPTIPQSKVAYGATPDFESVPETQKSNVIEKYPLEGWSWGKKKTLPAEISEEARVIYMVNPQRSDIIQPGIRQSFMDRVRTNNMVKSGLQALSEENLELANAFSLWVKGVHSKKLEHVSGLTPKEKSSLEQTKSVMVALEEAHPKLTKIFNQTNYDPDLAMIPIKDFSGGPIIERPGQPQHVVMINQNQQFYPVQEFIHNPLVDMVRGRVEGFAKERLKNFAEAAVKKATGKTSKEILELAAKTISKKAVATGAKAVGTAAVQATGAVAAAGAEVAAGPGGWLLLAAQAAMLIGQAAISLVKKVVSSLAKAITGEEDKGKQAAMLLFMGGAAAGVMGAGALSMAAVGGGAFLSFVYGYTPLTFARRISIATATFASQILFPLFLLFFIFFYIFIVPVIIAWVLIIAINSGAYVTPRNPSFVLTPFGQGQYFGIEKTVDPEKVGNYSGSQTFTYTIRIWAKSDCITITEATNTYTANKRGGTHPSVPTPPQNGIDDLVGKVICPSDNDFNGYTFTYTLSLNGSTFSDSSVVDTIKITASLPDGTSSTSYGSASLCIGDCPDECPSGWPVLAQNGQPYMQVTQGPYGGSTHSQVEGIDITTPDDPTNQAFMGHEIYSTHAGIACNSSGSNGAYGQHVYIVGKCNGTDFVSVYGHLEKGSSAVANGTQVARGQLIGLGDDTGGYNFPHLHYEFSVPNTPGACGGFGSGLWSGSNRGPIIMAPPFLPKLIPVGCFWNCNVEY